MRSLQHEPFALVLPVDNFCYQVLNSTCSGAFGAEVGNLLRQYKGLPCRYELVLIAFI